MSADEVRESADAAGDPAWAPADDDLTEGIWAALDAAGIGVWSWPSGGPIAWSPRLEALHGLASGAFAGTPEALAALVHPADRDQVESAIGQLQRSGGDHQLRYRTVSPDGTIRSIAWFGTVLRSADGSPRGLAGVAVDETDRRSIDAAGSTSENQLQAIVEHVGEGITVQGPAGNLIFANDAAARLIGFSSAAELLSTPTAQVLERFELMDEQRRPLPYELLPGRRALSGERPGDLLLFVRVRATGEERWARLSATPVFDDAGSVRFAVNVFRDVTEQRRSREALAESEARYRLLFESNPYSMWVFDSETLRFLAVNEAASIQYGYSRDEFLTLTLLDIRPPEDAAAIIAKVAQTNASPEGLDRAGVWRHRRSDGSTFDAEVTTHAITFAGRPARLSLAIDVTERERIAAERTRLVEQLAAERARLEAVLEQLPIGVVIAEAPSGRIISANTRIASIGGRRRDGTENGDHPEHEPLLQAIERGEVTRGKIVTMPDADGPPATVQINAVPVRDADNHIVAGVATVEDITDRQRAEETLGQLAAIVENSHDAIIGRSLDGMITTWNRGAERLFGYRREEAIGQPISLIIPPERADEVERFTAQIARGVLLEDLETERVRKDGTRIQVALSFSPMRDASGQIVGSSSIARDITERARAAAEQRFLAEAGGVLAGTLGFDATLEAVARLAVPRLADCCIVDVAEADGDLRRAAVAYADPTTEQLLQAAVGHPANRRRIDLTARRVMETGHPVIETAGDAGNGVDRRESGINSSLAVPLIARSQILGVLTLLADAERRPYGADDVPLVEELSRRAALAAVNALLYAAEQEARADAEYASERLARLQYVTAALAQSLTTESIAAVVVDSGVAALDAAAGLIAIVPTRARALEVVGAVGYPAAMGDEWRNIPLDVPGPLADALRTGAPVLIGSRAELVARYPALPIMPAEHRALAVFPMLSEGRPLGALALSFAEERAFAPSDLGYMLAFVDQCTQALERARLYAAELAARERLAFLAEASTLLGSSLDETTTLANVARLVVPRIADWCTIHVLDDDGALRSVAMEHADPEKSAWAAEMGQRYPVSAEAPMGVSQVLRTGRSMLYSTITDAMLATAARDAEHEATLRTIGLRSAMIVPLVARERTLGAITLLTAESERSYDEHDLALAEDLARRCAVAVDNARLYRQARDAVRARDEFLSIASHELRTPVTSIKGYTQMLLRAHERPTAKPERVSQFLRVLDEATDRLGVLTNDLLDVSRIQLGQLPLRPQKLDIADCVETVVERMGAQIDQRHPLHVRVLGQLPAVSADPDRIEQVLTNLIDNAAKYSPEGGAIEVTIEPSDGGVLVSVIDQGIGLPNDDTEIIFEPFNRAANAMREGLPGLGLGLYICRSIAERHGGRIWAESGGDGQGTTMRLWLPADA